MSDIKKSERTESKLEVIHGAYAIRMAVTNLAENNFYITFSKIEEKINNRIKGLDEKEQIRIKENMYKFYRNQINRVSDNVIELATGISRHLRIANTIFPTYMSEFEERRIEMDRAMACCNALQDELQYVGECLYADLNRYMNLVLQIQKEFNMIKSLRQTDNRFLKNIKNSG
jgi:hypothetical protein